MGLEGIRDRVKGYIYLSLKGQNLDSNIYDSP
jgi:hypothetical protein